MLDVVLSGLVFETTSDETLGGVESMLRILYGLAFGDVADVTVAVLGKRDHGGGGSLTFSVFNNLRVVGFHDGYAGVGGSQINANDTGESSVGERGEVTSHLAGVLLL